MGMAPIQAHACVVQSFYTHLAHLFGACSKPGIDEGNIEIAIIVRKGIGGTCPLRAAARTLETHGILPLLLGSIPWKAIEALPSEKSTFADLQDPFNAHGKPCSRGLEVNRVNSPYKLIPAGVEQEIAHIPPADTTTVGEWFASVRASASQIWASRIKCQDDKFSTQTHDLEVTENNGDQAVHSSLAINNEKTKKERGSDRKNGNASISPGRFVRKKPAKKGLGSASKNPRNCLQDLLEGDDCREEVDELISDMKLLDKGRSAEK